MKIRNHFRGIWLLTDIYIDEITGKPIFSGNKISKKNYGIYISYSSDYVVGLGNNHLNDNLRSIYITYSPPGQDIASFVIDIDASNTVNGKHVYYWVKQQNMAVPPDAGYVGLLGCTNIQVQNLNHTCNSQGVLLVPQFDNNKEHHNKQ